MALKSYRLKRTLKNKVKKKKRNSIGDITRTGVGAVIGVSFISTLTGLIN